MRSRLIFAISVAVLFLSTSIISYSQTKTTTADKTTKQMQEKQVTPVKNTHTMKTANVKTTKKIEKSKQVKTGDKIAKVEGKKVNKEKTVKSKALYHHKKMEKKTSTTKSDTPQKK